MPDSTKEPHYIVLEFNSPVTQQQLRAVAEAVHGANAAPDTSDFVLSNKLRQAERAYYDGWGRYVQVKPILNPQQGT